MKRRSTQSRAVPAQIPSRTRAILLGLAGGGAVLSAYLTYISYRLHRDPSYQSVCTINAALDCDRVMSSAYASLLGTPIAWFGVWFYALFATAVWTRQATWPTRSSSPAVLLVLMSGFSVALSVWLAGVSVLELQVVCLLCTTLYGVNLALLVMSCVALRQTGETLSPAFLAGRSWRRRRFFSLIAVATFALVIAPTFTYRLIEGRSRFCDLVTEARLQTDGPLTLTIYSDLQCPHCRALNHQLRPLRSASRLRIIDRQYPLDPACNPRVTGAGHAGACLQARAVICARSQARDLEVSERLYDEGPVDSSGIIRLAKSLGLDEGRFEDCLTSAASARELEQEMVAGRTAGVHGTPTVIFDTGNRYLGVLGEHDISCLADAVKGGTTDPVPTEGS